MQNIYMIDFIDMVYMLLPVGLVGYLYFRWCGDVKTVLYAHVRMLVQLLAIGYLLVYIFKADRSWLVLFVVTVMLVAASSISMRAVKPKAKYYYLISLSAIGITVVVNLFLITQGVLKISPRYNPTYVIPLAGMIFSVSMNAVALASERFEKEREEKSLIEARSIAFQTALIPVLNSLFAVGLVSLPGMMTGQILSGVDPMIAVRYQIVVMLMLFASAGMASAIYLWLITKIER